MLGFRSWRQHAVNEEDFASIVSPTEGAGLLAPPTAHALSPCAPHCHANFEKRIDRLGERVYCAIGYALSNVVMVAVDGGKVIVDTTESLQAAREIKLQFDKLVSGPVKLIIYTHSHPDHILGTSAFHSNGVPIWAHENFSNELRTQMGTLSRTLRQRSSKQFGDRLPPDRMSPTGIGPGLRLDDATIPPVLFPTHTFHGQAELTVGGVDIHLRHAPGETRDHLFVHLPGEGTVLAGDNIYRAFPNLYAIRGAAPRPVREWAHSLDEIRWLQPEFVAMGHTAPLQGRAQVADALTAYRDAIAYLQAEVVRRSNQGQTPDELVQTIRLPEHLRHHPFLQETYGKLSWAVRGIYEGNLGWFDGNATNLQALAPSERSARMLELIGGASRVEQAIARALRAGESQWAAELCDLLLADDASCSQAKRWKAEALEQLADGETNPVARNYYRSSSVELQGVSVAPRHAPISAETLRDAPIDLLLQSFPLRLRPELTERITMRIGFESTDSGKRYTLYIRQGVGEVRPDVLDSPNFTVSASEADFRQLASGTVPAARAALWGSVRCTGGLRKLRFLRSILFPP